MSIKVLCISDVHSRQNQIPLEWLIPADVIVCSGDVTMGGYGHEVENFLEWYSKLDQYKYKILVAGNHDWLFQDYPSKVQELLKEYPNVIYLEDSEVVIEGVKFYGSPWQPTFFNWAFNLDRGEKIKAKWDLIPNDTNVLITHGPALNYGDLVVNKYSPKGANVGCKDLLDAVERIKPKYHIFGHTHNGEKFSTNKDTVFINASIVNEEYLVVYPPVTFEVVSSFKI